MTVREAANRLEVSVSMVYALCGRGRLAHTRIGIGRGTIRICEDDLKAFLAGCRSEAPLSKNTTGRIKL